MIVWRWALGSFCCCGAWCVSLYIVLILLGYVPTYVRGVELTDVVELTYASLFTVEMSVLFASLRG